jgi:hypothetical protein
MLPRSFVALLTRLIRAEVARQVGGVRYRTGTVDQQTGPEGDTMVVLDGWQTIPSPTVLDEGDEDPDDPNPAVPAVTICGHVGIGERVLCASTPDGGLFVTGSVAGGQPRVIGETYIAGGTANITAFTASGGEETLTAFDTEVTVPHDRHSISITANMIVGATVGGSAGLGNVYRVDTDGNETFVGRWFTDAIRATSANGQTCAGEVTDYPDPGVWTYRFKVQVIDGFTIRQNLSVDPLYVSMVKVVDRGPAVGIVWPT